MVCNPSGVDLPVLRRGRRSFWECANLFVALPFGLIAFTGMVYRRQLLVMANSQDATQRQILDCGRPRKGNLP
jgi:hypothetical protein